MDRNSAKKPKTTESLENYPLHMRSVIYLLAGVLRRLEDKKLATEKNSSCTAVDVKKIKK
jgi:hypothetical protein